MAAGVAVLFVSLVMVAGRGGSSSPTGGRVVLLVVLGGVALFVLVNLVLQLAGFDGDAPEIAERLASDPDQQRLLARWLQRARWARFVGGFSGLLAWVLATNARGDALLFGTGGIAVGAVCAELHHIRRARGPRTARITARTVGDYLLDHDARWMLLVAGVAVVVGAIGVWAADTRAATWWALGALVALGVARLAQHRVANRARPAVSDRLTAADDLARELAIGRGLARPATYFSLAIVARGCFALEPVIGEFGKVFGFICWLVALYLWWQNRRLGLDSLVDERREPLLT